MKEIKRFEDLETKKYYIAKHRSDPDKYFFICRIIKGVFAFKIYGFDIEILDNTLGWESRQMTITFPEFRDYVWYELTEDEAMVELL